MTQETPHTRSWSNLEAALASVLRGQEPQLSVKRTDSSLDETGVHLEVVYHQEPLHRHRIERAKVFVCAGNEPITDAVLEAAKQRLADHLAQHPYKSWD